MRHFIISKRDNNIIKRFLRDSENSNLIPSAWHEYSRDIKINGIIEELKKRHCA